MSWSFFFKKKGGGGGLRSFVCCTAFDSLSIPLSHSALLFYYRFLYRKLEEIHTSSRKAGAGESDSEVFKKTYVVSHFHVILIF